MHCRICTECRRLTGAADPAADPVTVAPRQHRTGAGVQLDQHRPRSPRTSPMSSSSAPAEAPPQHPSRCGGSAHPGPLCARSPCAGSSLRRSPRSARARVPGAGRLTNGMIAAMAGPKATKKHKFVKAWVQEHVNDHYVKEATRLGYRSRAAFKLLELAEKDKLLRPGHERGRPRLGAGKLGAGAAREARARRRGSSPSTCCRWTRSAAWSSSSGDFREDEGLAAVEAALEGRKVDLVVSDLAPNLSGVEAADQARSVHLGELALEFARQMAATRRRFGRQSVPGRRIRRVSACRAGSFRQGLRAQTQGIARSQPGGLSGGKAACRSPGRRGGAGLTHDRTVHGSSSGTGDRGTFRWPGGRDGLKYKVRLVTRAARIPNGASGGPAHLPLGATFEQSAQECRHLARDRAGGAHRRQAVRLAAGDQGHGPLFRVHGAGQVRPRRIGRRSRAARSSGCRATRSASSPTAPATSGWSATSSSTASRSRPSPTRSSRSSRRSSSRGSRCCC